MKEKYIMKDKMTLKELVEYAEIHGVKSAARLMIFGGYEAFDFETDLYDDIFKIFSLPEMIKYDPERN